MRTFFRRNRPNKYDPVAYWNNRSNPNNAEGTARERIEFDSDYIARSVEFLDPVLEVGPGVGRTFSAYPHGHHITTLDLSHTYSGQLSEKAAQLGIHLSQHYLSTPLAPFPFESQSFPVGVASQVLLHIPPDFVWHSLSELVRVYKKVVIITAYQHELPTIDPNVKHVFNHNYFTLSSDLGCAMHNVIMNQGRICFTLSKWPTVRPKL